MTNLEEALRKLDNQLVAEATKLYTTILHRYLSGELTTSKEIRDMIKQELLKYNENVQPLMEAVIYGSFVNKVDMSYAISKPQLSKTLYKNAKKVSSDVYRVLIDYTKHYFSINDLTKKLMTRAIDIEDITPELLNVPKYVQKEYMKKISGLKTKRLRTSYINYINVLRGVSNQTLESALKRVAGAKAYYYAKRISHTESFKSAAIVDALEWLERDDLELIQHEMSTSHTVYDECDIFNNADFGWGKGIYPKELFPTLPHHPFCRCRGKPIFKEIKKKAGNFRGLETAMNKMTKSQQKQALGSNRAYKDWKQGKNPLDVVNMGKIDKYKIKTIGEVYNA